MWEGYKNKIMFGGRQWGKTFRQKTRYRLRFYNDTISQWPDAGGYACSVNADDIMGMLIDNKCHEHAELLSMDKDTYNRKIMSFMQLKSNRWFIKNSDDDLVRIPSNLENILS